MKQNIICGGCGLIFDYYSVGEWCQGAIQCPNPKCGCLLDQEGTYLRPKPDKPHWG